MRTFAHPPPAARAVHYRSIEPSYGVYGWQVRIDRPALEWSQLRRTSRRGFVHVGSGHARVTTARLFPPGVRVLTTLRAGVVRARRGERHGRRCRPRDAHGRAGPRPAAHAGAHDVRDRDVRVRAYRARPQRAVTAKSLARPARVCSRKRTRSARTVEATRRPPTQAVGAAAAGARHLDLERVRRPRAQVAAHQPGRTSIPARGSRSEKRLSGRCGSMR